MKTSQEQLQTHAALGNVLIGHDLFGGLGSDGPLQGLWIMLQPASGLSRHSRLSGSVLFYVLT